VFDRTVIEGRPGADSQTMNLAPSQGGWAEFTLAEEGSYPFVTHSFADAGKGAVGVLQTTHAPKGAAGHDMGGSAAPGSRPATSPADVNVTFGDMWIKASAPTVKAGRVTFGVKNEGATMHGLAMVPAPAKVAGGVVDPSTFLAKGADLAGGGSETVSADLRPGSYELICHMPGHYAAGQTMPFEVTG
jgi:uncharacterized cupredoxin-like copper-binding protein